MNQPATATSSHRRRIINRYFEAKSASIEQDYLATLDPVVGYSEITCGVLSGQHPALKIVKRTPALILQTACLVLYALDRRQLLNGFYHAPHIGTDSDDNQPWIAVR